MQWLLVDSRFLNAKLNPLVVACVPILVESNSQSAIFRAIACHDSK